MSSKNGMSKIRKPLALAAAATVAISMAAVAAPAQAADQTVNDVTLTWGLNLESGAGAFQPGACNFLSAGKAGNSGSSRAWTQEDGFYKAADGNVSILKDGPNSSSIAPTWDTKCQTGAGTAVSPVGTANVSNNKVVLSKGSGSVDPASGEATISWKGSFTSVFYSGLTYWTATDPVLTVKTDGTATLKASGSGYQADMNDASTWVPIAPQIITLANLKGVTIDSDGFSVTPEYKGVAAPTSVSQVKEGANWGSFPADFIDFQGKTGTQSYWYSSGGSADARKVATPLNVGWTIADAEVPVEPEAPENSESKDVEVGVAVPEKDTEPSEPGVFKWSIADTNANLGAATQNAAGFTANGALPAITVNDGREVSGGWSLDGKATDFVDGSKKFGAKALGWTPAGSGTAGIVNLGAAVAPATGSGLSTTAPLASATGASEAVLNTGIQLLAPAEAAAGNYSSTLTITAIQK